jgi:dihydrodipicolinate synthase/N-acetylneuraminate lyase
MLTREDMVGPWAGMPVAWDEDFAFDEDRYRADVARACAAGVPGVYTAGSTGEFYAMELDEWKAVTRATVDECRGHRTPVMIGVTSTYTLGAQRRAAYAAEVGADAVQAALPYWMEIDERQVVPFFEAVAGSCPGLGLTVYETLRAKKALSVAQHRAVYEATGAYLAVKANADTIGRVPEGCEQLSKFINVWVGENEWNRLGPHGAIGCASSLVYMNPRVVLHMFGLVLNKQWEALQPWTDRVERLLSEGLAPFEEKGFTDTAYDRLLGVTTGFLGMDVRSRGPYTSATQEDVQTLRTWMQANTPELLEL